MFKLLRSHWLDLKLWNMQFWDHTFWNCRHVVCIWYIRVIWFKHFEFICLVYSFGFIWQVMWSNNMHDHPVVKADNFRLVFILQPFRGFAFFLFSSLFFASLCHSCFFSFLFIYLMPEEDACHCCCYCCDAGIVFVSRYIAHDVKMCLLLEHLFSEQFSRSSTFQRHC